jgi:hypothetical protein
MTMAQMDQKDQLAEINKGDVVLVFDGYSGLGYKNVDAVSSKMAQEIGEAAMESLRQNPATTVWVVAGATADGIGECYDIAKKVSEATGASIKTVGIVSSEALKQESWGKALPDEQAAKLDRLIVADDPNGTWQVIGKDGKSMMVSEAFEAVKLGAHARFVFMGGGAVAKSELDEIATRLIKEAAPIDVEIMHGQGSFAPDEAKAAKKMAGLVAKGKTEDKIVDEIDGTSAYPEGLQRHSVTPLALDQETLSSKLDRMRAALASTVVNDEKISPSKP